MSDAQGPRYAKTPDHSGATFGGYPRDANDVTGFREYERDGGDEWDLPREVTEAFVGSDPSCQIVIPVDGVSQQHVRLQRVPSLRIADYKSKNGTVVRGMSLLPKETAEIEMGDLFTLRGEREVTLLAMTDHMRKCRPAILDILGTGFSPSADALLREAARGSNPLLLVGDPSSCVDELGELIHQVSPRRASDVVSVARMPETAAEGSSLVKRANHSTLILSLAENATPLKDAFVHALFDKSYDVRLVVVAQRARDAHNALGEHLASWLLQIHIRPLAYRRQDIPAVVDRRFETASNTRRFADLTSANQQAILEWGWEGKTSGNLRKLRQVVDALAVLGEGSSYREAAQRVGTSSTSLWRLLEGVNLTRPLFRE